MCIRDSIADLAAPLADRVETDALGNVLAFKKGRSSEKTLMVDAHMDDVGILVNYITCLLYTSTPHPQRG